jgi:hypothetical protein
MANCTSRWAADCSVTRKYRIQKFTSNTSDGSEVVAIDETFFSLMTQVIADYKNEILTLKGYNDKFEFRTVSIPGAEGANLYPSQSSTPAEVTCPCGTSYTPSQAFSDLIEAVQECLNSCCGASLSDGYTVVC